MCVDGLVFCCRCCLLCVVVLSVSLLLFVVCGVSLFVVWFCSLCVVRRCLIVVLFVLYLLFGASGVMRVVR